MTSSMLLSCLYLFVVSMLRSRRDSLTLAVIFMSAGCEPQVKCSELGLGCHGFIGSWGVVLSVSVQEDESPSLQFLGASSLVLWMRDWTLTRDLRRRLNSFGTRSLRRILGYRWSDFVSNEQLLRLK